jgi:hypothetical protein
MGALPFLAFHAGHPFRIRYMTPLVAASALFTGFAIGFAPPLARLFVVLAAALLIVPGLEPFDHTAPLIVEARREERHQLARHDVTAVLKASWDGTPILMSMGSLAHYMHDLSNERFGIRDFLHEGNGEIWIHAVRHPAPFVEWIAIEERAEGGDALHWQALHDPNFLKGFARVAEGGNVGLYRRRSLTP